ncbi:hypothetical protein AURDEDRAFT_159827 [Auricularia subglabra TFB-10046 SS5]|nr:hypothetical protein AURDEDRAFT_159827 [Auricularia subglabra TFB-10046 SS5]
METQYAWLSEEVPTQLVALDGSEITAARRLYRLLLTMFVAERCRLLHCMVIALELRRRPQSGAHTGRPARPS